MAHASVRYEILNLVFPPDIGSFEFAGYRFTRVSGYEVALKSLHHIVGHFGEFDVQPNTGGHAVTAVAEAKADEPAAVFDWEDKVPAIRDACLLLSLFTQRYVWAVPDGSLAGHVILADPRVLQWGGTIRASLVPRGGGQGADAFERALAEVYSRLSDDAWLRQYDKGHLLLIALNAFRIQPLEVAFVQCWSIWESLFALHNRDWLSTKEIVRMHADEKIAFVLVQYALRTSISDKDRNRIHEWAKLRHRMVHAGRLSPDAESKAGAELLVRTTEYIIARVMGLLPNDLLGTMTKLESFLAKGQGGGVP